MAELASKSALKFLDEHRRGRLDLVEEYELTPWAAAYAALHRFGYPNNKLPKGKQSTFSYVFTTPYDGLYLELSDFKAYVTMHLVYSDVAGEEMAQKHKEELRGLAKDVLKQLRQPVDHFGALFDPLHCTFTE
ncbi:MAG: hypothetical protein HS108_01135 [Planctomycetes bacterium]|jgi:hypothetical protein|nr:hypothetical protein [Planctomycetota bacterium]MCL4730853.1 hypothetical protein [Planctomycetota bacterium]